MRHRRGFTLIELIIYVGIFSIAAGLLIGVLTTFTKVQVRESATTAVSQEAQFVIQTIQRLVTDASLIELQKDTSSSILKLRMPTASLDPTCIQFSNGTVYLMQGNPTLDPAQRQNCLATSTSQAKTLTTSKVVVNSLTFKKFENPPATDTVKIDLTISYNSTNPQESAISRTLQTAIAKVSAATFDSDIVPSADNTYDVGLGANRWKNGLFSTSLLVGYTSVTGGVAAFNGNVGIGTSTPAGTLHVSNASSSNALLVAASGNVAIGTTSPQNLLQVGNALNSSAQSQGSGPYIQLSPLSTVPPNGDCDSSQEIGRIAIVYDNAAILYVCSKYSAQATGWTAVK
jgi:prepilin-type N-terminal cleavage/methylation domain-containing protein